MTIRPLIRPLGVFSRGRPTTRIGYGLQRYCYSIRPLRPLGVFSRGRPTTRIGYGLQRIRPLRPLLFFILRVKKWEVMAKESSF